MNSLPDDPRTRTDHGQLMKGGRGELFLGKVQGQPKPINPGLLRQNGQQLLLDSTGNRREFPADLKPGQEDVGPCWNQEEPEVGKPRQVFLCP